MTQKNNESRPGVGALQNMQLLKKESTVFKVPKVPSQRVIKKAKVLDEEDYVEGIAKIIQRDFFPDLEKLKAQNDFLEAQENRDYARLRELTRKYSGSRPPTEPYNSPATFDTPGVDRPYSPSVEDCQPGSATADNNVTEKPKDITENHTLDSYLASHTSEDNASYDRVIALEDKKRATKLVSQLQSEISSAALADSALALPSIEQQADQTERPEEFDTWRYRAKNFIMYVPDGAAQPMTPKPELQHHNTRLRAQPFDYAKNKETISALARSQDASIKGKIGVDGVSITCEKGAGAEYLPVGTPSPRPGAGPDCSPLMTWGEIEGTPFRLDGGDTPLPALGAGAAYHMLEGGARERIGLQLAEQVAKRRRPTTPRVTTPSHSFRTNTERLASMSPAARKLAAKHLLSPRLKLTPNDMGISHTTPKRTPMLKTPLVATPKPSDCVKTSHPSSSGNVNNSTNLTENNNITDNLLQINVVKRTRLKAQDFFK
ncbi:splicing factor ESS-2 homolog [Maniola hyperantus]|uniref:splicing factor ESS-2 homolog n=1 Tax=Aphantopus hyperantus TaxID=2795564 RepID=UPI0015695565|nr:splicing factor ESS-2 homolog [Maniola hyperantus]